MATKPLLARILLHIAIFKKNDERTTYNMIYVDGATGVSYGKRFNVTGVTSDKEYDLTKGSDKSKVHYFTANANGEAEVLKIVLSPNCTARIKELDYFFEELEIKGRSSQGNTVTKYPIKTIKFKEAGRSTLAGRKLWFDTQFGRLNIDEKGTYLGSFEGDDKVLVVYTDGNYEITDTELTQRFDADNIKLIERFDPEKIVTIIYHDADKNQFTVKRFKIDTTTLRTKYLCIKDGKGNAIEAATTQAEPVLAVQEGRGDKVQKGKLKIAKMVDVMGWKAIGAKLLNFSPNLCSMHWEEAPKDRYKSD